MNSMQSLIFYLSSFGASAYFISYGLKKKIRLFIVLGLVIPILVSGFRYGVGTDYFNYINIFNTHKTMSIEDYYSDNGLVEIGYFAIEYISYLLGGGTRLLFIITSALTLVFFYLGLKRLDIKYIGTVYFLYLTMIFPMTMNAVRQGVAISIMFFAMTFIMKKKPVAYLALTIIAGMFHISALLLLPFYFIGRLFDMHNNDKTRYFVRLLLVSIVVLFVVFNVFNIVLSIPGFEKYLLYTTYNEESGNLIFYFKLATVLLIGILARYTIFNKKSSIYQYAYALAVMEVVILVLGFTSPFIKREALYFSPFFLIALTSLVDVFKTSYRLRVLSYIAVVMYGSSFFTVSYYVLDQADVIPYNISLKGEVIHE